MNRYLIVAIGAIGLLIGAWANGYSYCHNKMEAENAAAMRRMIAQHNELTEENEEVSRNAVRVEKEIDVQYRTITKKVFEYVQNNSDNPVCLTDDGLQLWNAAITGEPIGDTNAKVR